MRPLVNGFFSFSCATIAAVVLFMMVTTTFVSIVALWKGLLGKTPWPGPEPGALYLLLLLLLPLLGAMRAGRAVYSRLEPSDAPPRRITAGHIMGFAAWLVAAVAMFRLFWQ